MILGIKRKCSVDEEKNAVADRTSSTTARVVLQNKTLDGVRLFRNSCLTTARITQTWLSRCRDAARGVLQNKTKNSGLEKFAVSSQWADLFDSDD